MDSKLLEIEERDEAGNLTASYYESSTHGSSVSRIDVQYPEKTKGYLQRLIDVFLPAGYPHSVTEDYIQYQIYDSLQAFSSSIAGLLSSRAVLEGVGVGDPTATAHSALLLTIFQDSLGRLATILFAYRIGLALEPECKMYRLLADIFNDTAMVLDCISPAIPGKAMRVGVLAGSSVLRSLCGVAAGSAKASLSAHFARAGNLGEVNAKDSSQETVISLLGMLAGTLIVSHITTPSATWSTLILLLSIHLLTNHRAVRAVSMTTLNRQRANIVFSHLLQHDKVLKPTEVSKMERIFERDGVLRWFGDKDGRDEIVGWAKIGVGLGSVVGCLERDAKNTTGGRNDLQHGGVKFSDLLRLFADEAYILYYDMSASTIFIVLKSHCKPIDQIQAWAHALLLARGVGREKDVDQKVLEGLELRRDDQHVANFKLAEMSKNMVKDVLQRNEERLRKAGWDLDVASLETRSGVKICAAKKDM
ncbi:DUF647-domain-containing protein [Delitschia confertaspora ATCC 74209]|uniref:DUF647-domain-containing protein n=1 Tax=Delitschia confertaspora ATCC 74209 TaxID=1513339 RepID=A0A9P4JFE3_9PLEO|nr:DUF647-domain-containing protein [Delitschia confertaspora ATCC 74209]